MKYTIEIPTLETMDILTTIAYHKAQKWLLDNIVEGMKSCANVGEQSYTQDLDDCPYCVDQGTINEVQNVLREMGYITSFRPRKSELTVDWSPKGRRELQSLKDGNCFWRFPTREEIAEQEARINALLGR